MKIKVFFLILLLVLVGAVVNAGLVVIGTHYVRLVEQGYNASPLAFLSATPKRHMLQFVEVKNLAMNLRDDHASEQAVLLDLIFTTPDDLRSQRTENMLPVIKGITADIFSSLTSDELRSMSLTELRQLMMEKYQSGFDALNVVMPFTDLTLSKMVFK
ncbi:hypothetical protein [Erwinia psidii]|uniref:Flagellar protein FliL n=1 Tax=Erwinia psidii TaxID=69224 RepID=A0A3N6RZ68_9GAMM|nr:hypothetical protein [Erwinia psidii]MCX8957872.1 hypothetical protein [Erwinia psidii]MCX8960923.1 hypothetical protein [Erwinia psidii]MCX8964837.1 hypothetical protein [Erwinia psidii]RQM38484.1 hypothetical protein EB241_09695 [Erwinia psidii]